MENNRSFDVESKLHLIGTNATKGLTLRIREQISIAIQEDVTFEIVPYDIFANGECKIMLEETVRGKYVYVITDCNSNGLNVKKLKGIIENVYPGCQYIDYINDESGIIVKIKDSDGIIKEVKPQFNIEQIKNIFVSFNDRLVQSNLLLQASKKHGAKKLNIIYTCYPYSRQDKPIHGGMKERVGREPSSAQRIGETLDELGVDNCITVDIHNSALVNAFKKTRLISLYVGWFIKSAIEKIGKKDVTLSTTDEGGLKKIDAISKDLGLNYITVLKKRNYAIANSVGQTFIYGDVQGKDILIHDDMLDTGGTLCKLIDEMYLQKPASINIAITHGMFNGNAIKLLTQLYNEGKFEKIYVTNTVSRKNLPDFIEQIDASKIFANTIISIFTNGTINYNDGY